MVGVIGLLKASTIIMGVELLLLLIMLLLVIRIGEVAEVATSAAENTVQEAGYPIPAHDEGGERVGRGQ